MASPERSLDPERSFFITAAKGTEGALRDELRELRIPRVRADRGGVHFGGDIGEAFRVCLHSRIGVRVLRRLARFESPDADALYDGVADVDWTGLLDARRTMAVRASVKHGGLRHSSFVAQRAKDAVVDQLRSRLGARPDVDRRDPDVQLVVHIAHDVAELFVDVSGQPLTRRGYRKEAGDAPLKEHLAAAVLRLTGYRPGEPLVDPMCGSGTFLIEAALWGMGRAVGVSRDRFGVERWADHDGARARAFSALREEARERTRPQPGAELVGLDRDPAVLAIAARNAERAGVRVGFDRAEVRDLGVEPAARLVTNPPYGERLERPDRFDAELARVLTARRGQRSSVLLATPELARAMRVDPVQEHTLYNGDIECRLFSWEP